MTDAVLVLGRLLMAFIFIAAGFAKLMAPAATQALMAKYGLPVPVAAYAVTVIVELGGGLLLLFGFMTRPVALVLGVWCIATALVAHANFADPNMRAHFTKNVAIAGGFLYVWAMGAGAYSIDAWRRRA
ncbi:MAG TPA: DoxX family protein [Burkholderiaceae bacterium]|nr:DoxX family protein [Burkholderiaceae bacterium]